MSQDRLYLSLPARAGRALEQPSSTWCPPDIVGSQPQPMANDRDDGRCSPKQH